MMHIGGEKQLQNFEAFLEGSECTSYDDIYTEDYDWLPLWKVEFARENRDSYGEMQRKRKGQQVAREQKKFERIEMRDQQGQLKQRQQLKQVQQRQDQLPAHLQRTVRSSPSSSAVVGFSAPRYTVSYILFHPNPTSRYPPHPHPPKHHHQ